jgi:hypothetical protein
LRAITVTVAQVAFNRFTDPIRAVQKYRQTETARNSDSVATGGSLGVATLEAFDGGQGRGLDMKSAIVAAANAAFTNLPGRVYAAARYDFRCPPNSPWQTSLCFARSTIGGSSSSRTGGR